MANDKQDIPNIPPELVDLMKQLFGSLSPGWQKAIAAVLVVAGALAGFIAGHNTPRPVQPVSVAVTQPDAVVPFKASDSTVLAATVPVVTVPKYTLYGAPQLKDDPTLKRLGVHVDPATYPSGSTVRGISLPCVASATEVVPFTTVEAWAKGK